MTQHSEDETFKALKRTPFRTVFLYCTERIRLGETVGFKHRDYLATNGWSLTEFIDEVGRRRIDLSVTVITDQYWREGFRRGVDSDVN